MTSAVKRRSNTRAHRGAVVARSPRAWRVTASSSLSTMRPVTPLVDHLRAPSRSARRPPACRTPSPRSSRCRRAPASRSGTAMPRALPRNSGFCASSDLADELDVRRVRAAARSRARKYALSGRIDLRGDLQRHPDAARDGDGAIHALLRRDAAEEREVVAARTRRLKRHSVGRHAVVHGADPVGVAQRPALVRPRSTTSGNCVPAPVGLRQVLEVQAAMQRRQRALPAQSSKNGKWIMSTWKCSTSNSCMRAPHLVQHASGARRGRI